MTERLYYTDGYLTRFESPIVDSADGGRRLYLERTAFYPTSGGQPHDAGILGGRKVLEVVDEGDRIAHVIAGPVEAEVVEGEVAWIRRYDHMQQHTGQHLISAVWVELFGVRTLSFHMGPEVSTIELETKELTDPGMDRVEARANQIVREARPVRIGFEDAGLVEGLRKPSARGGTLRIITIEDLDRSACGGTHTRSTAEVGPVQIRKWEKLRGNVRVEFVCGERAVRRTKQDFRILTELSRVTAAAPDQVPEAVGGLRKRLADTEKERLTLEAQAAKAAGASLYAQTPESRDGVRRVFESVRVIDDAARARAAAFAGQGRAVVLLAGAEPQGVLIAASPDAGFHAGTILKGVLSEFGARGGGSAVLAQGSCPDARVITLLQEALGFEA